MYDICCGVWFCLAALVERSTLNGWRSLHIYENNIQHKTCPARFCGHFSSSPSLVVELVLSRSSHQTEHSDTTVPLPLRHLLTGTIFCFTCLSAVKSASHDYMNVFPASHCRTYYNTKLLQLSACSSCLLLTVFGPEDATITTTIAPTTQIVGVGCVAPATVL